MPRILPTKSFRGLVEDWHRNVTASTATCACEELGLPIEECICSKVGVGASHSPSSSANPPGSSTNPEGPLQEASSCRYESGSSSIAPTEYSSVFDTEFSELMNDPDRDSLDENPPLQQGSYAENTNGQRAETANGKRTHGARSEDSDSLAGSGSHVDPEDDNETIVGQRSNGSNHSGITACFEPRLAELPEVEEPEVEAPPEPSVPQPAPLQSLADLLRDSPEPRERGWETSVTEGYDSLFDEPIENFEVALDALPEPPVPQPTPPQQLEKLQQTSAEPKARGRETRGLEDITEGENSEDERPKKQRKLA